MPRAEASPPPPEASKEKNSTTSLEKTASTGLSQQFGDMLAESMTNKDVTSAMIRGDFVQAAVAASQDPEIQAMMSGVVLDLYGQFQNAGSIAEKSENIQRLNEHSKLGHDWRDRPKYAQEKGKAHDGAPDSSPPPPGPNPPNEANPANPSKEIIPAAPAPAVLPPDHNHVASLPQSFERLSKADPTSGDKLTKKDLDALLADPKTTASDAAFASLLAETYESSAALDGDSASISEADLNAMLEKYPASLNARMNEELRDIRRREQLNLPRNASEEDIRSAAEARGLNETIAEIDKLLDDDSEDVTDEVFNAIQDAVDKGISAETVVDALNEHFKEIGFHRITHKYDRKADVYNVYMPLHLTEIVEFSAGPDGQLTRK